MVFAASAAKARAAAEALLAEMQARRDRFFIALPDAVEGVRRALAARNFPVCITDAGDNPGSGGIGDTPGLLRTLLAERPELPVVFAFFTDPGLVTRAAAAGVSGVLEAALGGRLTDAFGPPVAVTAAVEKLTDGRFRNVGPMKRGGWTEYGPTALLRIVGTQVRAIVTTLCRAPNDPGLLALHGIDLAAVGVLCLKSKNHFRAAYAPLLADIIDVDAPGPAALNFASLPFRHAPRHLYPLGRDSD
jgi:microcystin degradation protein MlrC